MGQELATAKKPKDLVQLNKAAQGLGGLDVDGVKNAFKQAQKAQTGIGFALNVGLLTSVTDLNEESALSLIATWEGKKVRKTKKSSTGEQRQQGGDEGNASHANNGEQEQDQDHHHYDNHHDGVAEEYEIQHRHQPKTSLAPKTSKGLTARPRVDTGRSTNTHVAKGPIDATEKIVRRLHADMKRKQHTEYLKLTKDLKSKGFVHLMVGCLCTCKAPLYQKASALFSLFDSDDDKGLTRLEAKELALACITGVSKITACPMDCEAVFDDFTTYISDCVDHAAKIIRFPDILGWMMTPSIYRFAKLTSTLECKKKAHREMIQKLQSEMELRQQQIEYRRSLESDVDIRLKVERKFSKKRIFALKQLFDKLDVEQDGHVQFKKLLPYLHATPAQIKKTNPRKLLKFSDFLCRTFPYSNRLEREVMLEWVHAVPVTAELVQKMQKVFDHLNVAFTGRVMLARIIPIYQRSKLLKKFVKDLELHPLDANKHLTFPEMLEFIFGRTHHHQLKEIHSYAKKSPALTKTQLVELKKLFRKFDKDDGGSISFEEFKNALIKSGVLLTEIQTRYRELNANGDSEVSALEYLRYYASNWTGSE
mmetsp:Transcript_7469/g.14530  ORF Transcript_7469/g.14530 Transcript_7469/m.14530 type:complete len:593 (-) Transcript_7469:58-1836(-)|eukprot:CAMPEP_0167813114 /NCGR_PEP_ID=MMETSP0112_2-20121227/1658_1 /TAXON_ID=91324 /ORGANISM="Lotharella globosa, Strain CCCM811" /LENGTH=592 /DNA_ID=CAMNT_0007712129 /DNA_START=208 /DNA_END=1986 /DNA_ORIENTATION=+